MRKTSNCAYLAPTVHDCSVGSQIFLTTMRNLFLLFYLTFLAAGTTALVPTACWCSISCRLSHAFTSTTAKKGAIMKYMNIFKYLVILLLTISCAGQCMKPKEKSSRHPQVTEMQERKQPKLAPSGIERKNYIPRQILVKFKDGTDTQAIEAIQRELHLKTIKVLSSPNLYLMKILDGSSVERTVERLRNYEEVKYSEPNYVRTTY